MFKSTNTESVQVTFSNPQNQKGYTAKVLVHKNNNNNKKDKKY